MNYKGDEIAVDAEGYLKNHQDWSEELAQQIADNEAIVMTEAHWEVVRSCKAEHQICSENTQPYKEGKAVLPFFTR